MTLCLFIVYYNICFLQTGNISLQSITTKDVLMEKTGNTQPVYTLNFEMFVSVLFS